MFTRVTSAHQATRRILWPVTAGLLAAAGLSLVYFGIVSWAESPRHALELFWADRWIVLPIIAGFGVQAALYIILKKRLYLPAATSGPGGPGGPMMGASGATSGLAMVACCAHHVTDVLPLLGLTVAATFLARYRTAFMLVGLAMTFVGIGVMLSILLKERRKAQIMLGTPAAEAV